MSLAVIHNDLDQPSSADLQAWKDAFGSEQARATSAHLADLADEAEAAKHAASTREAYDYWWGRFITWLADPTTRTVARAWPATPIQMYRTVVGSPTGDDLLFSYLSEYVYGPEDPEAAADWLDDGGPVSPNTLGSIVAAVRSRTESLIGMPLPPSTRMRARLTGMRRHCRERYGADRQAYPLLTCHVSTIARYLDDAREPLVLRDRAVLELIAAGVTAAEIARLGGDCVHEPDPGVIADGAETNRRLWDEAGILGLRTLVVPGQIRKGNKQDPPRLIVLEAHHPLTCAIDEHLPHRSPTDPWLIDGLAADNRRSQIRDIVIALGRPVGWAPTREHPRPDADTLGAMRHALAAVENGDGRRRRRDLAMFWIGFLTAFRRSELLGLTVGDLKPLANRERWIVSLGRSKTDQDGKGVKLPIDGSKKHRGTCLDPLHAITVWLDELATIHGGTLTPATPLWPALTRTGEVMTHKGRAIARMSDQAWADRVRLLAVRSGAVTAPDDIIRVSGHSLRRGYVTQAAMLGRTALEIRQVTRHKNVNQLAAYVDAIQFTHGKLALSTDDLLVAGAAAPANRHHPKAS